MTTKKQQIENSLIYFVPVIVGSLLPIVALPIFTRILTKEDFGAFALAQLYAILFSGLANLGLPNIYNRNFFQFTGKQKASGLFYSILLFVGITSAVLACFTFVYKEFFSVLIIGSVQHADLLFWAFCSSATINIKGYYLSYYRNSEDAGMFSKYTIADSVLAIVLSLWLVAYLQVGVVGLVWGPLLASLVILIILVTKFYSFLPPAIDWGILKYSLKLGYPLTLSVVFKVISTQFDKYMIGIIATIGGVGIYSIGNRIAYLVFIFMNAIQNVFAPQVYKKMFDCEEGSLNSIGDYLTPFLYVSVLAALLISLFSEEVIFILTPESYHGSIDIVIVLSMFYGSLFFGKQPQLIYAEKTFISSLFTMLRVGLNIILNIFFIMKWGAVGAAWATLIAGLITGGIHFVVSQHYYKIEWEYGKIIGIYIIFFISSISMVLLRYYQFPYMTHLVLKLISLSLYVYLGIKLQILTFSNCRLIKEIISRKLAGKQSGTT